MKKGEMVMDKKTKFRMVCFGLAALCFAIVSYGYFHSGQNTMGILFLCVAVAEAICVTLMYVKARKKN